MVNFEDILYTPLDVPEPPEINVDELLYWIKNAYPKQKNFRKFLADSGASAENCYGDNYPWDLVAAYYNFFGENLGWVDDFDKKFPNICEWIFDAFNITPEETGAFVLLPLRATYSGWGFWHKDIDETGLRWYLDFENYDKDKLFMKRNGEDEAFECPVVSKNQCFFLNNFRATHATYTEESSIGMPRIASFILPRADKPENWINAAKQLVVDSAEKYKNSFARFY